MTAKLQRVCVCVSEYIIMWVNLLSVQMYVISVPNQIFTTSNCSCCEIVINMFVCVCRGQSVDDRYEQPATQNCSNWLQ